MAKKESEYDKWGVATRALRAGESPTEHGEHSEAVFLTSSFTFDSAAEAAARFAGQKPGNIYSRFTNPTVNAFERRLAALEGGEHCVAFASGMAAILATCMAVLKAGDHIVASRGIFGTTVSLFQNVLPRFGIDTTFVPLSDNAAWGRAVRDNTRLFFLETPSNPLTEIGDIRGLGEIAHAKNILLAVDNAFCSPALQQPLRFGADLVIHSVTKYIDGQGRCLGGAVVGNGDIVGKEVFGVLRTGGAAMSPFNAWTFLKGLETLPLRMRQHSANALQLALWLEAQKGVRRVYYPGLPSHPQHPLALKQQSGFGGIVSFDVEGGQQAAWRIIDATEVMSITANLGDVRTTITHPATTTHGKLTPEQRKDSGIGDGLIRVSVGLEDIEDLQADLARGLAHAR